ncbi:MAG TPA: alternative ribosome rescue aminoacyl-tRNA hydrolase ArfB [Ohtaekwangia sp.]|nr:alternative ribosome rescue aminoacyl-tRNA hydrolase ArfB [Ohtaekwangia sp.]
MPAHRIINAALLGNELVFTTSRSSGPGGQNVNKVNTKVTLRFHPANSTVLTAEEKDILAGKLAAHLTNEGVLVLTAQDKRSQLQNKEAVIRKFEALVARAFVKKKARKVTKPSKRAVQNRILKKKLHGEKKKWRQKPE